MAFELHSPEAAGMCPDRLNRIKPAMQERLDSRELVGLSTMISRRGKIVYFEQQGLSNRESNHPMSSDTLFRLYSMTKPIVCTAFMGSVANRKI